MISQTRHTVQCFCFLLSFFLQRIRTHHFSADFFSLTAFGCDCLCFLSWNIWWPCKIFTIFIDWMNKKAISFISCKIHISVFYEIGFKYIGKYRLEVKNRCISFHNSFIQTRAHTHTHKAIGWNAFLADFPYNYHIKF